MLSIQADTAQDGVTRQADHGQAQVDRRNAGGSKSCEIGAARQV